MGGESGLGDLVLGVALRQPGGERKPPTRNEDAVRLGERALWLRDVQDPEVHRDRVERRVGEGQPQRIAHHEREVGTAHASPFDHRGRDVHAHRVRSARPSRLGEERPTRHIEKPRPLRDQRGMRCCLHGERRSIMRSTSSFVTRISPGPVMALGMALIGGGILWATLGPVHGHF